MTGMEGSGQPVNPRQNGLDVSARIIRILSVPPVLVILLSLVLYFSDPAVFGGSVWRPVLMCLFLALIPSLGYPLQLLIPTWKEQGRPLQRKLAFVFSVTGYMAGLIYSLVSGTTRTERLVYFSYVITVLFLIGFNVLIRIRSSGHAAGIAGPLCILVIAVSPWLCLVCIPIWLLSLWASVRLKRHTIREYLLGTACSLGAIGCAYLLLQLFP